MHPTKFINVQNVTKIVKNHDNFSGKPLDFRSLFIEVHISSLLDFCFCK
jgi:hypothetical protein